MFLNVSATTGQSTRQRVPIGELANGLPIELPVFLARGDQPGPTLYVQAGIHGDEQTGMAICRDFIASIDAPKLAGTVVAIPVANVPAFLTRTRGYRNEERWMIDPNRIAPGSRRGLLTERLVAILFEEFVAHADLTIDLHSALDGCDIVPFTYIDPNDDTYGTLEARRTAAEAFGTPYILKRDRNTKLGTADMSNSLYAQADVAGHAMVIAEMGESTRISWDRVEMGVEGLVRVLDVLGIQPDKAVPRKTAAREITRTHVVHAELGGTLRWNVGLGDEVTVGQPLGTISDVFGTAKERIAAPTDGIVFRIMRLGSVATGAECIWIAE